MKCPKCNSELKEYIMPINGTPTKIVECTNVNCKYMRILDE